MGVTGERGLLLDWDGGFMGERFVGDATVSEDRFNDSCEDCLDRWGWFIWSLLAACC